MLGVTAGETAHLREHSAGATHAARWAAQVRPPSPFSQMIDADDYSAACDDLADLGLTEDQIDDVWRWHRITQRRQVQTAGGVVVVRLLSYIFGGNKGASIQIRAVGMLFAFDLEHLAGYTSLQQAAEAIGCSQPALTMSAKGARRALEG